MRIKNEFMLIALLGLLLLGLIAAGVQGLPALLPALRLLLGLFFVLFVPGYALQATLFPRRDDPAASEKRSLDGPERVALSFVLSLGVIAVMALALDRLPWGIRLWPIVTAEGIFITTCSLAAWLRRRQLPREERSVLAFSLDTRGWWAAQDRTRRILYGFLAFALLMAGASAVAVLASPKPGERFTEFYMLGEAGLAESYPREATAGQPVTVTVGITNREEVTAYYWIEVRDGLGPIGQAGSLELAPDASDERPVIFVPTELGEDVKIEFLLYRDAGEQPYRSLRLWLKVKARPQSTAEAGE
jgi:uncharacterized membrane protein